MKATKQQRHFNVNDMLEDSTLNLTEKEIELIKYLNDALKSYFGETHSSDIDCNDISEDLKWKVGSVKGVVGSLVKKKILGTYDTGTGYEVVHFVEQEDMTFWNFKVATKIEAGQSSKQKQSAHTVGDIHKNGLWSWTEYKPGKFDWRTIKVK